MLTITSAAVGEESTVKAQLWISTVMWLESLVLPFYGIWTEYFKAYSKWGEQVLEGWENECDEAVISKSKSLGQEWYHCSVGD